MVDQKVVAIIPARGGSKGIPGKNLKKVGGRSLIRRAIESALSSRTIDSVWVTTDDEKIKAEALNAGARVIDRPDSLSDDQSSSESALMHAIETLNGEGIVPEVVVFLQATSVFIKPEDLDQAVMRIQNDEGEVCFSAFETYAFLWKKTLRGAEGVNHDHRFRPRRQEREPHFQETGAFYVMKAAEFIKAGYRFFGRVLIQEVSEAFAVEIDNAEQLEMAAALSHLFGNPEITPGSIKALVMDFDGVHTDDRAHLEPEGVESVSVSRSDGLGISMLKKAGIPMLILSKEQNSVVSERAKKLGIEVLQGVDDKLPELAKWCEAKSLNLQNVCYMGNDVNDLECLEAVGWPATPSDAKPVARSKARLITSRKGGDGAVREVCDLILAQLRN